jgi:hypothetical protein
VILFLGSASQDAYGEERDLVRKWLPAILIGFCLSQVDIDDKTKLADLKGAMAYNAHTKCSKNRLGA